MSHTFSHARIHPLNTVMFFFVITPSRTHYHWRQYAKEPACKGNRQPGALLYYNSHNIHYIIHIWLIFLVKQVQDHSMFWDQYLSQSHAHRCAELYLSSLRRRSASFRGNAMEPLVYDTVMNANRTGHLQCHERYAERRIMLKAAHTNQCELPYYEKQTFFKLHRALTRVYMLYLGGMHRHSRVVFWELFLSSKIGKPETKQQTFGKFSMKTKPQRNC